MKLVKTNLKFKRPLQRRSNTNKIIIHHADATKCDIYEINRWHLERGFKCVGYHFLVRKDGKIETGRPIDTIGAHCQGQNSYSIGICFEGNFEKETMTKTQLNAGRELIDYIKDKYGNLKVTRHKDFNATSCPGKNFPFDELIAVSKPKKKKKKKYLGKLPDLVKNECLGKGDKGEKVRLLQLFLNWYGDYGLVVDSDFGSKTESAVKNFQTSEKLTVDGLFGANSLRRAKKVKR